MSAIVMSIANQKGGVGKTTIATQFAFDLAIKHGQRVLYVDMDAQGNGSTVLLRGEPITGTEATSLFDVDCKELIPTHTSRGIDLLPTESNSRLSYALEGLPDEYVTVPRDQLKMLRDQYDVILVDCPPNLGLKLRSALVMSTHVCCPIRLCGFAVDGLSGLIDTINDIKHTYNPDLQLVGALINAFDRSTSHVATLAEMQAQMEGVLLPTVIKHRTPLDRANTYGIPIWEVSSAYRAAQEIDIAFRAIYEKLGLKVE